MPKKKREPSPAKDAGLKAEYNTKKFKRTSFLEKVKVNALKDALMPCIIETKDPKALAKRLEEEGVKVLHVYELINAVAVEMPANQILKCSKDSDLDMIHEDMQVHTCLDVSVPHIGAPQVWKSEDAKGEGVVVAVVDTGIDLEHPDLKGKVIAHADFTNEGYFDGNGHGTHVAATIAGTGKAEGKYIGVAPEAKLIAAKVLASNGSGTFSGVIAGIEWAAKQKPDVMNLSLGADIPGSCDGTDPACMAVDAAVDQGIVMCIAAGNAGPGSSTVGSPGCAKKVITVGASDDNDNIAWFSSRGPTKDNRVKPDILLPGVNIIAARAKNTSMGTIIDEYYTQASGTSMATPHCAGVAALLKSKYPDLTPQEVKDLLMATAIDLEMDPNTQGHGRVDVPAAFTTQASGTPSQKPQKVKATAKSSKKKAKKKSTKKKTSKKKSRRRC
ncbi:MAG: S8 family peptidase [Candidatus Helarchaeota archaeon]